MPSINLSIDLSISRPIRESLSRKFPDVNLFNYMDCCLTASGPIDYIQ